MNKEERRRVEIEWVSKLPDVYVDDVVRSQQIDPMPKVFLKRKTLEQYQDVLDKDKSFWFRVKQFLRAENDAGRIAKIVKDFGLFFLPYGKQVGDVTELVSDVFIEEAKQEQIKYKEEENMSWFIDRMQERSTWRGITVALTSVGVAISPDQASAITGLGVAVFVAIEVFTKDQKKVK